MSSNPVNSLRELARSGHDTPEFKIREGELYLLWACPRCGTPQETKVELWQLLTGIGLVCKEKEFCGDSFEAEISLQCTGLYKGLNDVPLVWSKEPKDHPWRS